MKKIYTLLVLLAALASAARAQFVPAASAAPQSAALQLSAPSAAASAADPAAALEAMYAAAGSPVFPSGNYLCDFGYPALCIAQDAGGPDMVSDASNYNWFSAAADCSDRNPNYVVGYLRYQQPYVLIRLANAVLDPSSGADMAQRGQALAMRAFGYLSLAPYFQFRNGTGVDGVNPCVPLVTETTADPANNPRASVSEVYDRIMTDLTQAIIFLEGFTRPGKYAIDRNVAYGLRARARLLTGLYAEAAQDAAQALEGYTPATRREVSAPAFCDIAEHNWIWGIRTTSAMVPHEASMASWPSMLGSFTSSGYTTGIGCYKHISALLYRLIPESDVRRGWWVDENLSSPLLEGLTWKSRSHTLRGQEIASASLSGVKAPFDPYTNVKFGQKSGIGAEDNRSDWPLMRAEEMILIQAEGLAMSGQESEARQLLESFLREHRDPQYVCAATSADELQLEIWKQRRIELWGEGFSMSDVMRLHKPVVRVLGSYAGNWPAAHAFNVSADDPWLLLRFPESELAANPACTQNGGGEQPAPGQNPALRDGVTDEQYKAVAEGTYTSEFFEQEWAQTLEYCQLLGRYRFSDLWFEGSQVQFTLDSETGELVPAADAMTDYTSGGTGLQGWYTGVADYGSYGPLYARPAKYTSGAWASQYTASENSFAFIYFWEVAAGQFGHFQEEYKVTRWLDGTPVGRVEADRPQAAAGPVYDLSGRRVAQPGRGLYIVGGKKVLR